MVKAAILGYGTVGSGVAEVLSCNQELIAKRAGNPIEVKYILDLRDFPGDPNETKVVHDIEVILQDPEISIVCETMGGNEPAYTFSKRALDAGKSVCTSNKERIVEVSGILNGTTNYILTKMEQEGMLFEEALGQAQALGYAERNPEADVEGYDACRKIAILTSLVAGKTVDFHKIHTEGITGIDPIDFAYAKKLDATIKLLAVSRETEDGYQISVAPYLLKKENALAGVNDVFNAVAVCGNTLGDTMFYGRGAGKLPTASAVVADVVECARHLQKTVGCLWEEGEAKVADFDSQEGRFFVRVLKKARADVEKVFGAVVPVVLDSASEEFAFVTESMQEAEFEKCREQIFGFVKKIRIKD